MRSTYRAWFRCWDPDGATDGIDRSGLYWRCIRTQPFDLEEAVAVDTQARPKAEIFQLKAPLLSVGRDNWPLIRTDLVSLTLKVYAEGGENAMHYHTNEEHSFIVLQGEATFHLDTEENAHVVHQWEG